MGKRVGGLGTTLVLALVIVLVSVGFGIGISRFDFLGNVPLLGRLLEERPPRTATGPVVVEGVRELDQLATVRWTESVPVTRQSGGDVLERLFSGEEVLVIATGQVEAGVDLSEIDRCDVRVEGETVTMRMP